MENEFEKALKIINEVPKGTTLLLHSCCAPCSSACLELLHEHFSVTVLYYNPNIQSDEEYEKRKAEQIRFIKETGWADIVDCDRDKEKFIALSIGLESCPERGDRCYKCYTLRLEYTAKKAKELGFDYFSTTLSISPYKVSRWLNEIGYKKEQEYGVKFLPSDFKKKGGYLRSIELAKEYGLYRQDFCGCEFSKIQEEKRRSERDKIAKNGE